MPLGYMCFAMLKWSHLCLLMYILMFILMLKWVKTPLLPWNHRGSWFDSQPYDWTDIGTGAPVVRTETGRQEPDEEAVPGRWKWHELLVVYFLFDDAADAFHNREEGNDYLLWVFTHGICNCIVFRTVKIIYIYIYYSTLSFTRFRTRRCW